MNACIHWHRRVHTILLQMHAKLQYVVGSHATISGHHHACHQSRVTLFTSFRESWMHAYIGIVVYTRHCYTCVLNYNMQFHQRLSCNNFWPPPSLPRASCKPVHVISWVTNSYIHWRRRIRTILIHMSATLQYSTTFQNSQNRLFYNLVGQSFHGLIIWHATRILQLQSLRLIACVHEAFSNQCWLSW